ncbi:MAG: recombinase family protein [Hymenobacter sp.]|nr:MAG: recombinase family protein [Hymenobacter sp.]
MQQAVIFVRVSKKEQDYQRQVEDLRALAQSQAVQVVAEISEKISGAKRNQDREGIQQLLALSRRGTIQKVLVSAVSRLGRSTVEVLHTVEELTQLGISIYLRPKFWVRNAQKRQTQSGGPVHVHAAGRIRSSGTRDAARAHSLGHGRSAPARDSDWPPGRRDGRNSRLSEKVCVRRPAAARRPERT